MEHEREDGKSSQVLISDVKTNDTGTYACKVANSHGKDEMFIKLTVQGASTLQALCIRETRFCFTCLS